MTTPPVIGFISPPAWFDPAPAEFPRVVVEPVRTQQTLLPPPECSYRLDEIATMQPALQQCARSLHAVGCALIAQVGSPFAWAGVASETEARQREVALAAATRLPTVMTGLAIVDGLRALGVQRVAVNCTYYAADWRDQFAAFLQMCGFTVVHVSTLTEQGLTTAPATFWEDGWAMTTEQTQQSIWAIAQAAPTAEAQVITGAGTRTLGLLSAMETATTRPIIAADTIMYWAVARHLGLTLTSELGMIGERTKGATR